MKMVSCEYYHLVYAYFWHKYLHMFVIKQAVGYTSNVIFYNLKGTHSAKQRPYNVLSTSLINKDDISSMSLQRIIIDVLSLYMWKFVTTTPSYD